MAAHIGTLQNARLRSMALPREHGAWGMLLVPLATGGIVAMRGSVNLSGLVLYTFSALSLFWLRTPLECWLGTSAIKVHTREERAFVLRTMLSIGLFASACVAALLWDGRNLKLIPLAALAALAFAVQAAVKRLGRLGRMPAQVVGAIGLTSTAAGAYYVATGQLDRVALGLWLANWIFAGNQIHFVQLRIRSSRATSYRDKLRHGLPFLIGQIILLVSIVLLYRLSVLPVAILLAFLPIWIRGALWFVRQSPPLDVHRLGFGELAQALLFGGLLSTAFLR